MNIDDNEILRRDKTYKEKEQSEITINIKGTKLKDENKNIFRTKLEYQNEIRNRAVFV